MRVRTYIEWCDLRPWLRKKGYFFRTITDMWSYTLCDGAYDVYKLNRLYLMTIEARVAYNNNLLAKWLSVNAKKAEKK